MGREAAAAGTGFIFHSGFLLPAASEGGRGAESRRAPVGPRRGELRPADHPAPARCAHLPAGLPLPGRLAAWPGNTAVDPEPAGTNPRAARRTRGPARRLLRGPRCPAGRKRPEAVAAIFLAESARTRRGSRLGVAQNAGS